MNTLLKNINIQSFKGIDESSPVIIDFNEAKNIVYIKGDEGKRKTSTLEAIMWLMGAAFDVKIAEMFHDGQPINEEMDFEHEDKTYKVIANGDKIVVKSLREGDGTTKDRYVNEPSPKDLLQKIFKKCIIKNDFRYESKEKQLEWVGNMFPLPKDAKDAIQSFQGKIKEMRETTRPTIGREMNAAKSVLESNPLFAEWKQKGDALSDEITKMEKKLDKTDISEITGKYNQYKQAETALENFKEKEKTANEEIAELERQLSDIKLKIQLKTNELDATKGRINDGEAFLVKNKKVLAEYEKAIKDQNEVSDKRIRISDYERLIRDHAVYNEKSDEYIKIDSLIQQATAQIKNIKADYVPEIPGIDFVYDDEMQDNQVTRERGIYYKGHNIRTISGSEYVQCLVKIIRAAGARFIFIDDLATYGSETISYINELADEIKPNGGVVFASEMERGSELIIEYKEKI